MSAAPTTCVGVCVPCTTLSLVLCPKLLNECNIHSKQSPCEVHPAVCPIFRQVTIVLQPFHVQPETAQNLKACGFQAAGGNSYAPEFFGGWTGGPHISLIPRMCPCTTTYDILYATKSPRREVVRSSAGAGVVYPPFLGSFA